MAYFVFARDDISHLLTRCTDSIDYKRERNLSLMRASVYVGMSPGCRIFAWPSEEHIHQNWDG